MNYATTYQSQVVARQRMAEAASAARQHTRRHDVSAVDEPSRRSRRFHFTWHHAVGTAHT